MKSPATETSMDVGSSLRSRRLILLLTTVLLGSGSPCVVVSSIKTASGAPSTSVTRNPVYAQYCNPAVVNYILRDENGKVLTETEIKTVYEQLPKAIGDARLYPGQVSFSEDERTFYLPESVDWQKGRKQPSLEFVNAETCTMQLTEVTLIYHGKTMRLIFDINIARSQSDRRLVVDSLPFQEGTFGLDQTSWSGRRDQIVPSERWKRIKT
jgi:hypothetical protein